MMLLTLSHVVNVIVVTIIPVLIAHDAPAMTALDSAGSAAQPTAKACDYDERAFCCDLYVQIDTRFIGGVTSVTRREVTSLSSVYTCFVFSFA
jgi:hypothetical protein